MNFSRLIAALGLVTLSFVAETDPVSAQAVGDGAPPTRVPAEGIAVLDCAPAAPAPADSCIVRVPPNQKRGALTRRATSDRSAEFRFVRSGHDLFPSDVDVSATVLLIDRTPGLNGARRATWPQVRAHARRFAQSLPSDEQVAVYTFDESLQRLVDFTTDRNRVLSAIEDIQLGGLNTRIATNTREIVSVLNDKSSVLLKNVVVITDGVEEGGSSIDEVTEAAQDAGVTISALGMIWAGLGDPQASTHMDFLEDLTKGSLGSYRTVRLLQPEKARVEVGRFIDSFNSSIGSSGLIVPLGDPAPAEITVTMQVPVPGQDGAFDERRITASFVPEASSTAPSDPEAGTQDTATPEEPENLILGYPAMYAYIAAGVLGALLLLLLLLLVLRKPNSDEETAPEDDGDDPFFDDKGNTHFVPPSSPAQNAPPPIAFLVVKPTGERLPVRAGGVGIGRSSENGITLNDPSVSRVHAQLAAGRGGGFSVTDLDSLNGTFVNEKKVSGTRQVKIGDTLGFGTVRASIVKA